jgi:predicted NACHT family NTPase
VAKPSLCASQQGTQAAKQALTKAGWTQKHLSILVGSSRQPITNFFKGVAIAQPIFVQICDRLNLDWQQIADFSEVTATESESFPADSLIDLNVVLQDLRSTAIFK